MIRNYRNTAAETLYRFLIDNVDSFPVSFCYNGNPYSGFSPEIFKTENKTHKATELKEINTLLFKFDESLKITLETAFYPNYGVFEWTLYFENTGNAKTGIISDVKCCDIVLAGEKPVLRGILGDHENQYRPYEKNLEKESVRFRSDSGRPTHVNFPYFNLEHGTGGTMFAIGWAGTWMADFDYKHGGTNVKFQSTNDINTFLKPKESIRSALVVVAPYALRDENYAVNLWREWFIECNMPRADASGKKIASFTTCCLANDTGLPNTDGSISERYTTWKPSLEKMIAEQVKVDFRWLDAGWYIAPDGGSPDGATFDTDWFNTVGTWELDPVKWPGNTFRMSTDFAREHGMKTLMWFEPERVTNVSALIKNYGYKAEWAIQPDGQKFTANNIGNPDCLKWTTDRICKTLRENGVELYREDNNINPAMLWQHLDTQEGEDRKGITECKIVMAHYKLWDDIIASCASYGGCTFVDSCASGGGRNDIESLRRGIPLLRSDADRESTALRLSMTTSFNKWIPFCGACTKEKNYQLDPRGVSDQYVWRASYLPVLNVDSQFVQDPEQNFDILRFGINEWKTLSRYLLCDFYVLTPWHSKDEKNGFTAYSFYDEKSESGILQIFKMEDCEESAVDVRLPYAENEKTYELQDADTRETVSVKGGNLSSGITFTLSNKRMAKLYYIRRK